jgi:protein-tyrosine kinase
MSRIHEALKKAAQERSAQLASGNGNDTGLLDLAIPPAATTPAKSDRELGAAADRLAAGPEDVTYLRYEELIKRCAKPAWKIDGRASAFEGDDDRHVCAERFRTLRSRLYQVAATRPLRRIMVTSSLPAEGKTFVAVNLAHSIVRQPDRKVLLIDADLRASRLHQVLGAPRTPGLSDYLRGEANECQIIQKGTDANLCLIAGGREVSDPSELLMSERLGKLFELVTPMFDWVIIDTPPALPVHDASMMADLSDGVLFVVRAGTTDHEMAAKATAEFQDRNLLGVVLNRVENAAGYGGYYYGYPAEGEKD